MQAGDVLKRPTARLSIIVAFALVIGGWMAWQGLVARLTGSVPSLTGSPELWVSFVASTGFSPAAYDWPLVVLGTSWWGAALGLWTRNKWGWPVTVVLAALSLLHAWELTLMAAVVLALLLLPAVRRWGLGK
jgi:hypothetical protein